MNANKEPLTYEQRRDLERHAEHGQQDNGHNSLQEAFWLWLEHMGRR